MNRRGISRDKIEVVAFAVRFPLTEVACGRGNVSEAKEKVKVCTGVTAGASGSATSTVRFPPLNENDGVGGATVKV
jgi:hypothetical protein